MANSFHIAFYTLGGLKFWRDCFIRSGWRIQQSLLSKRFRLLDNHNIRRASGSYRHCLKALNQYFSAWEITDEASEITLILPGLFRTRLAFSKMQKHLKGEGFNPVVLSYSSTRNSVKQNAKAITKILNNLPENIQKVNFVTYSLGGLVLREVIAANDEWHNRISIGRIVQIAPPNQGSRFASSLAKYFFWRLIIGKGLTDMSVGKAKKVPPFPSGTDFSVIAGFKGTEKGYNFLAKGKSDNDGIISINETKLAGASDFTAFRIPHFFLLSSPEVLESTERYLTKGHFSGKRNIKQIKPAFHDVMNSIY
ncbi:MAG: hypothetical protein IKD08_06570 [Alphaproteobacteria bacterium]|nr:hypothetical protein [Alphaproteobacteria bacterium]